VHRVALFDVNILVSAALSVRGKPVRCLALAKTGVVESVSGRDPEKEGHL
jgi:hypothetical protein